MRIPSGVSGFDDLVDGGFPAGRLYVLSGPPGSGKTTFSAQFVTEGIRNDESCLYVSMHESKTDIRADMRGFDFGFDRVIDSDGMHFLDAFSSEGKRFLGSPGESGNRNKLTTRLSGFISSRDIDRVVVDSTMLLDYLLRDGEDSMIPFLTALKRTDATTLLISEMTDPTAYSDEHFLAHGVVFFHNYMENESMTRGIQVIKMRGTDIDTEIHPLSFDTDGLHVHPGSAVYR